MCDLPVGSSTVTLVLKSCVLSVLLLFWAVAPCGLVDRRQLFGETLSTSSGPKTGMDTCLIECKFI